MRSNAQMNPYLMYVYVCVYSYVRETCFDLKKTRTRHLDFAIFTRPSVYAMVFE